MVTPTRSWSLGLSENRLNPIVPNGFADHEIPMKNGYNCLKMLGELIPNDKKSHFSWRDFMISKTIGYNGVHNIFRHTHVSFFGVLGISNDSEWWVLGILWFLWLLKYTDMMVTWNWSFPGGLATTAARILAAMWNLWSWGITPVPLSWLPQKSWGPMFASCHLKACFFESQCSATLWPQSWGCVWKCCVPHCTQWFCWSLSLNGYFIGNINPTFSDKHMRQTWSTCYAVISSQDVSTTRMQGDGHRAFLGRLSGRSGCDHLRRPHVQPINSHSELTNSLSHLRGTYIYTFI